MICDEHEANHAFFFMNRFFVLAGGEASPVHCIGQQVIGPAIRLLAAFAAMKMWSRRLWRFVAPNAWPLQVSTTISGCKFTGPHWHESLAEYINRNKQQDAKKKESEVCVVLLNFCLKMTGQ